MIKQIFCDLDGTLYNDDKISTEDIEAIKKIEEKGVIFNVATGRMFSQAKKIVKDNLEIEGYFICENGAFVYNNKEELVFKGTIDDRLVKKVINRFESKEADMYFKYKGKAIVLDDDSDFKFFSRNFTVDPDFINRDSYENMVGNIGIASKNPEELARLELYLTSEFGEVLDIYLSSDITLNIVPKKVSKRAAIEYVCSLSNIDMDEVMTIGDSPNDICMLDGFKNSVAMSSSREDVKSCAKYTTDSVAEAIDIIMKEY
ncbi:HAD family hydrolase [Metaclostridioides mangenotii]|uniref:HAD family hydrolase n=1 Tax=Metaclostridioides mangenotii TaxID=1540 RepID=UPI000463BCB1|nr:HAD family hydrolase [Clostridioides mangenotii]